MAPQDCSEGPRRVARTARGNFLTNAVWRVKLYMGGVGGCGGVARGATKRFDQLKTKKLSRSSIGSWPVGCVNDMSAQTTRGQQQEGLVQEENAGTQTEVQPPPARVPWTIIGKMWIDA